MKQNLIQNRLERLREELKKHQIAYYIIPTTDYHQSEYVSDYFKTREYFTGFTGSNGTLLVGEKMAGLWTDGRYFVQAQRELEGTEIELFPMEQKGVPTIVEYIKKYAHKGEFVGFDGKILSAAYGERLEEIFAEIGVSLFFSQDIADKVWEKRPPMPHNPIRILEKKLNGRGISRKMEDIRNKLKEQHADAFLLSKLDDIMWLFNIRGSDVSFNPVAIAHAYISLEEAILFVGENAVSKELKDYAQEQKILLKPYWETQNFISTIKDKTIWVDKENFSFSFYRTLDKSVKLITQTNPTELMKSIKNKTEIDNMKEVYRRDSACVCKFLYWLTTQMKQQKVTEKSAAEYMDFLRSENRGFLDLSFPTIAAYKDNAAMMHYTVSDESNRELKNKGAFLIDSGGQYEGGTTDVTRTVVLGEVSKEFKKDFTAVVSGMLQLQNAVFMEGCTGRNLDMLARQYVWKRQIDYKCGTGHGIGYMLNVHEGPQGIRWKYNERVREAILRPGMITSNEPGVYKEGKYGIRIENILLCVQKTENCDGIFLEFEPLTFVPIDRKGIDRKYITKENKERLNEYHSRVYTEISSYLSKSEKQWLKQATKEIK